MYNISILIANYNSSDLIRGTLHSLSKCNLENDCISVIDNKSNDGSFELARNILKNFHSECFFISEKDNGIYDALNKGIKSTNSKYVLILHSGDTIIYQSYNLLKEIIKKNSSDNSDCIVFLKGLIRVDKGIKNFNSKLIQIRHKMSLIHSNVVISRYHYEKYGLYDSSFKISADYNLIRKILTSGEKFLQIDLPLIINDNKGLSYKISSLLDIIKEGLRILNNSEFSRIEFFKNIIELLKTVLYILKTSFKYVKKD